MPIRWYGPANPEDPTYNHFSRIVNLTLHSMGFAAVNSCLWFIQQIRHPWPRLNFFTEFWLLALLAHFAIVVVLRPRAKELTIQNESQD